MSKANICSRSSEAERLKHRLISKDLKGRLTRWDFHAILLNSTREVLIHLLQSNHISLAVERGSER